MNETVRLLPGSMSELDALTCDDPITSFIARLSVSATHEHLVKFMNDEMQRPGASANSIIIGLTAYMLQMHASFAAYLTDETHADSCLAMFRAVLEKTYREHFIDCAKSLEGAA